MGTTFQFVLEKKISRSCPLLNLCHPQEHREYEGSANLLVWCGWRLDRGAETITSWDEKIESVRNGFEKLKGKKVIEFTTEPPAWDLRLKFTSSYLLKVFVIMCPEIRVARIIGIFPYRKKHCTLAQVNTMA